MSGLMKGRRGLVMGVANDHSIAWGIAKQLAGHGAELAFTYQGEAFGRRVKPLADQVGAKLVLPCDVEDAATVDSAFETLKQEWGGLDFLVHAIAYANKEETVQTVASINNQLDPVQQTEQLSRQESYVFTDAPLCDLDGAVVASTMDVLKEFAGLETDLDPSTLYTTEFLPQR